MTFSNEPRKVVTSDFFAVMSALASVKIKNIISKYCSSLKEITSNDLLKSLLLIIKKMKRIVDNKILTEKVNRKFDYSGKIFL